MGPVLQPFSGDSEGLRRESESKQAKGNTDPPEHPPDDLDYIHGNVTECRILATKNAGPMAFATVETATGVVEAILFPNVFGRYQSIISRLGLLTFSGKMDSVNDASAPSKLIVEHVTQSATFAEVKGPQNHIG